MAQHPSEILHSGPGTCSPLVGQPTNIPLSVVHSLLYFYVGVVDASTRGQIEAAGLELTDRARIYVFGCTASDQGKLEYSTVVEP